MEPWMIVLAVIVVVAVIGGIWFVASRRGSGQVPPEVSAHKPTSADDVLPAPPSEQKEGAGEAEESEGAQAPQAPTLERPESIPGRMQRLRARLAGSGGFGRAGLSVPSPRPSRAGSLPRCLVIVGHRFSLFKIPHGANRTARYRSDLQCSLCSRISL